MAVEGKSGSRTLPVWHLETVLIIDGPVFHCSWAAGAAVFLSLEGIKEDLEGHNKTLEWASYTLPKFLSSGAPNIKNGGEAKTLSSGYRWWDSQGSQVFTSLHYPKLICALLYLRAQHWCSNRTKSLKPNTSLPLAFSSSSLLRIPLLFHFHVTNPTPCRWEGCWTVVDTRQLLIKEMTTLYYVFFHCLLYHWLLYSCPSSFPRFFSSKSHM